MEYLIQFLSSIIGNTDQASVVFAVVIGVATMLFGLGALLLVAAATDPVRRRLRSVVGSESGSGERSAFMTKVVEPLAPYVLPKKKSEQSKTRVRLTHAGYRAANALATFYAIKLLLGLALPAIGLFGATFYPRFTTFQVGMAALALSFVGMMIPEFVLNRRIERRQRQIMNGFPDALDLLVSCSEAGLGLNAALQRVAAEISLNYPMLAEELALVNVQIRAGVDRMDALKELAERTGLEDIRGLVSLLAQSMRFGTGVADTLRTYAEDYRDKRMQRAEEIAAKVGTKLIFPLVFCMFPAFFIVAIGPAVLGVIRVLQGM